MVLPNRPYQRLEVYHIEEDRKILSWKMSTTKQTKCSGENCVTPGQLGTFRCVLCYNGMAERKAI